MFNSDGGTPFDFAIKHRGEWDADASYTRNDVVRYQNSIYICGVLDTVILQSSYPPPDDPNTANWELFYWNQWTKQYLTITNFLNVGGTVEIDGTLTVNDNATIYGDLATGGDITTHFLSATELLVNGNSKLLGLTTLTNVVVTSTATFYDVNINNQLTIGGLKYPKNKGTYGQVLFTGGDETSMAAWVNLGELVFWSLSDDLLTNGFNIVSGHNPAVNPNHPQMTIGTGATNTLTSRITFYETTATQPPGYFPDAPLRWAGDIELWGHHVYTTADYISLDDGIKFISNQVAYSPTSRGGYNSPSWPNIVWPSGSFESTNLIELNGFVRITNTASFRNSISGRTWTDPVGVGPGGFRFNDGTIQTSAVATFTSTQIATSSTLGVIRVGEYLSITTNTGILSVNTASLTALVYTLPIATTSTLGGVIITNTSTIVINTQTGVLTIPIATTSTLGVVRVGTTLSINTTTGALNVGAASSSTRGGIRVGYGLEIVDGDTLNLNTSTAFNFLPAATTSTRGGIRVGSNFTITNGDILNLGVVRLEYPICTLDVPIVQDGTWPTSGANGSFGTWLSKGQFGTLKKEGYSWSDELINGFNLTNKDSDPNWLGQTWAQEGSEGYTDGTEYGSAIHLAQGKITLRLEKFLLTSLEDPPPAGYRTVGSDPLTDPATKNYITIDPGIIVFGSDAVQMGYDQYHSTLRVSDIYNFAGTGAPFFPAGVQYQDNTIQRTAWRGYDQGLI